MKRRIRVIARSGFSTGEGLAGDELTRSQSLLLRTRESADGARTLSPPEDDWRADQPGHVMAQRILAEHAGLSDADLWPVDLSRPVATFGTDIDGEPAALSPAATQHGYRWHPRPDPVRPDEEEPSDASVRLWRSVLDIPAAEITFDPMQFDDLAHVVRWQQSPQSRRWFSAGPSDQLAAKARYGSRLRGESSTRMWVVVIGGRRSGYVQDYRVDDNQRYAADTGQPHAVGIDYLIGDPQLVGRGTGPRVLWAYLRDVLCREHPEAPTFLASPDENNTRSLRALEKCGFVRGKTIDLPSEPGEAPSREVVCTFDRATWFGTPTLDGTLS